ncbi:hypothetical protein HYW59_00070 [Candidatus Kaiserbacteria bacterium]|nr:hypothetical protein [Candidatus Kaiserbacteria bacterium]
MTSVPAIRSGGQTPALRVGEELPVGEFFWIRICLGFAENAKHGQNLLDPEMPGSADTDCRIRVIQEHDGVATVVLIRNEIPYGARAPHGTIFLLPTEQILRWPEMVEARIRQERIREEYKRQLGRVVV